MNLINFPTPNYEHLRTYHEMRTYQDGEYLNVEKNGGGLYSHG